MAQYAYLSGDLILITVLLAIYFNRPDLRRGILFISAIGLFFGFSGHYFVNKDYWNPPYLFSKIFAVEDWLYGLSVAGLSASVWKFVARKRYQAGEKMRFWEVPVFFLIGLAIMLIFNVQLKINSVYVASVYLFVTGVFILIPRRDLWMNSIASGFLTIIVTLFFYAVTLSIDPNFIHSHWLLNNLSGILVLNIPLEEYIFAFCWGFVAGSVYEYIFGLRLINIEHE